jgi:hypothetical protein
MDPMQEFEKYVNAYSRYHQGLLDPGNPSAGQYVTVEDPVTGEKKRKEREWTEEERRQVAVSRDAMALAAALPIRLSYEEFKLIYDEIADLRSQYDNGSLSEAEYQQELWDSIETFENMRADAPHYTPTRTDDGQPVDWDASNPQGMQDRLAGASSSNPALQPVIESARKGELASALQSIAQGKPSGDQSIATEPSNAAKPSNNQAVESFAATKQAQQSVPSLNMDLSELAGKSDKHLNDWLLGGKLLNMSTLPPDDFAETNFGGHSLNSIQAAPVGQRDSEAVKAWIEAMRAHHAKMVADTQAQNVAASSQQSVLQDVAGHADKRTSAPPVIVPEQAVEALTNSEPAEEVQGQSLSPMDAVHMGLDAIGLVGDAVVPGAGVVADGANALLYLARAASDPEHAGEHLKNALISGVSMVPFLGDAAKGFKYGANTGTRAGKANAASGILGSLFGGMAGGAGHGGGGGAAAAGGAGHGGGGHGANLAAAAANAVGGMGGGGGGAPPAQNPGGAGGGQGGGGLSGTLTNLTAIMGVAGSAAYTTVKAFEKLVEWLNAVDATSKKMIEENRHLAQYSGVTAAAYAQLDTDRILLDASRSKEMGGPLSRLTESQAQSEKAWEELTMPFEKLLVEVQTFKNTVSEGLALAINYLDKTGELIDFIYALLGEEKEKNQSKNAMEEIARDSEQRVGKRKWGNIR